MVMFYLMTRKRINLVRLIMDYIFAAVDPIRRSHVALPYGMLLTHIFQREQLSVDGHRKDEKHPVTTMKTFTAMRLKPQAQEEGRKKKKEEKKKEKEKQKKRKLVPLQKGKMKPFEDMRKKKMHDKNDSPADKRRPSKKRVLKLLESSSSSSSSSSSHKDETSAIVAEPMNVAGPTTASQQPSQPRERGIVIR